MNPDTSKPQCKPQWKLWQSELRQRGEAFSDDGLMVIHAAAYGRTSQARVTTVSRKELMMHSPMRSLAGVVLSSVLLVPILGQLSLPQKVNAADTNWAGLPQVAIPFFSVGGRATYFDPKEGSDRWFGGAQIRVHPSHYFAIEGSADYRREEFDGGTKTHTFPVQGSLLIYPIGTTRVAPFILGGGGWYFTSIDGPGGFSDTQQRFGGHVGGGVQFFINDHISIDSTYRHIWLERVESKNVSLDDKQFNDNGHMVTIGVNVHF